MCKGLIPIPTFPLDDTNIYMTNIYIEKFSYADVWMLWNTVRKLCIFLLSLIAFFPIYYDICTVITWKHPDDIFEGINLKREKESWSQACAKLNYSQKFSHNLKLYANLNEKYLKVGELAQKVTVWTWLWVWCCIMIYRRFLENRVQNCLWKRF